MNINTEMQKGHTEILKEELEKNIFDERAE